MRFFETSTKSDTNISEAFYTLAKLMIEANANQKSSEQKKYENKVLTISNRKNMNSKKKFC